MHIPIDPAASAPIYEQIREGIAAAILRGDLAPGEIGRASCRERV